MLCYYVLTFSEVVSNFTSRLALVTYSVLQYVIIPQNALPHHFQRPTNSPTCFKSYLAALAQVLPACSKYKSSKTREHCNYQTISQRTSSNHILTILTMKFTSTILSLAALFTIASAGPTPGNVVRYNTFYDNPQTSLNDVACSNGDNGLVTKGFPTFGSLPSFPFMGGVSAVKGWNSPECGSCWELTYSGTGNTIYVTAVDTISDGFDISLTAMNVLTNGQAQQLDSINVQAQEVATSNCY